MTRKGAEPIGELKSEHRVIARGLEVLERLTQRARLEGTFETDPFRRCVEFFGLFADACHHSKEEQLLFPALERRGIPREGGPIGVMLEEHRRARSHVAAMGAALAEESGADPQGSRGRFLDAAESYIALLRGHIFKEDHVLFEMGDGVLTDDDRARLASGFCDLQCRAFDGRTRDQLVSIVDRLEAEWLH